MKPPILWLSIRRLKTEKKFKNRILQTAVDVFLKKTPIPPPPRRLPACEQPKAVNALAYC